MSSELTPEDEELLERLAAGDVDRWDQAVQRRMAASPGFRRGVDEMSSTMGTLDRVRELEEADLAAARALATAEDRRMVLRALEGLTRRRRRRIALAGATAVAAALLATFWLRAGAVAPAPRDDGFLAGTRDAAPVGASATLARFTVDLPLGPGEGVLFSLYDDAGAEILRSPLLRTPAWQLSSEQLALLEGPVTWLYEVRDAAGSTRERGGPFRAWRSP